MSSGHRDGVDAGGNPAPGNDVPDTLGDDGASRRQRHGDTAVAGVTGASAGGLGVEDHDEQHHDDEPCLGSFGMLGVPTAPIGDFSPQFKFSFTEDIHLDLGSGLKVSKCPLLARHWHGCF